MHRFHVPGPLQESEITLEGTEAHHLLHVLRAKPGDRVEVFDGAGASAAAEILEISRKSARLGLGRASEDVRANTVETVIAAAIPKGDRSRTLIEKCTELGIDRLIPLHTTYSSVHLSAGKIAKLEPIVITACKQCGRNRLMEIGPMLSWEAFLESLPEDSALIIAHPGGPPLPEVLITLRERSPAQIIVAIGPEGGFSDEEVASGCAAGGEIAGLGTHRLRIETAAVAAAALLMFEAAR